MDICSICLNPVHCFYYKCKCNCKAIYHLDCLKSWFKYKKYCPICRKNQENNNIDSKIRNVNRFFESLIFFSILLLLSVIYYYYYR